mmetsp:Transcript_3730/g.3866  ORF Transcript_3730/g.3866 Transcript_3730/m.3866 type:complete len:119 (-) Transcript_3730:49-405(-)
MSGRNIQNAVPLRVFMHTRRVLKLYRDMLREACKVSDDSLKNDLRNQIRTEFKIGKDDTDKVTIKNRLIEGTRQLEQLQAVSNSFIKNSLIDQNSWINVSEDENDIRGRIGDGWPWAK